MADVEAECLSMAEGRALFADNPRRGREWPVVGHLTEPEVCRDSGGRGSEGSFG